MQNCKEKREESIETPLFSLTVMSTIGDRTDQQDDFGYDFNDSSAIVLVCDGMGGHNGGNQASATVTKRFLSDFKISQPDSSDAVMSFLHDATILSNSDVFELTDSNGDKLNAGSTLVSVAILKKQLFWSSVGDSRLYLFRDGELVQITQDHNYTTLLTEKLNMGLITQEEFEQEKFNGEALISYIGMATLPLIDYNDMPLELLPEDKLILMSDGLYKVLSDNEILSVISNFSNINEAVQALDLKAKRNSKNLKISRDNTTISILKIK